MNDYIVNLIYGTHFSVRADKFEVTERFIHFTVWTEEEPQTILSISRSIVFDIPEEI